MSLLPNLGSIGSGTVPFYNGAISQSARFGVNNVLTNELDAPSDRKNFTLSMWFKRCRAGTEEGLAAVSTDGNYVRFEASGAIRVRQYNTTINLITNEQFRDTSAWYHLVVAWDLDNGTQNDRVIIYVNGTRLTLATNTLPANTSTSSNFNKDGQTLHIGSSYSGGAAGFFDGYIADVNFVDGTALAPTSFGETKNGIWIPITPTGLTYGDNGFRLQFANSAVTTASSSTIGADTSGKDRHFTSAGIVASDCAMPDCPENNFATWNPIYRQYGDNTFLALTNGALFVTGGGDVNSDRAYAMSTMSVNEILRNSDGAGAYMEVRSPSVGADNGYIGLLGQSRADQRSDGALGRSDNSGYSHYHLISPNGRTLLEAGESSSAALAGLNGAPDDNAVIGFAVKSDGKFFISVDGTFSTNADGDTQNPATGANPMGTIDTTIDFFFHCGNISAFQGNFGQDSTFGGNETATTNADANGIGAFHGAVPTGYLAMCTSNMAEPTIGPNSDTQATDYFNTLIYTGNGTDDRAITGLGFKPDWCWFKKRSGNMSHYLVDSARGTSNDNGTGTVGGLNANATETEVRTSDGGFASFDDDGFTLGQAPPQGGYPQAGYERNNADGSTYVVWNWKANGGTATATISESGDNPAAVVQANATAGFSIITYTGTGANGTIAHGLGAVPKLMIFKNRDATDDWMVYHGENSAYTSAANQTISPQDEHLHLNNTLLSADVAENFNDTAPTSSVLTVGTTHNVNADGERYVAYVFAEVLGYSKFGSYIGIEESAGTFQYTGFRPAFLICKLTNGGTTAHWAIFDNKRETSNVNDNVIFVSDSGAENSAVNDRSVDFLSNGFKVRSSAFRINGDADTVVYIAFAEVPFKYANAK